MNGADGGDRPDEHEDGEGCATEREDELLHRYISETPTRQPGFSGINDRSVTLPSLVVMGGATMETQWTFDGDGGGPAYDPVSVAQLFAQ